MLLGARAPAHVDGAVLEVEVCEGLPAACADGPWLRPDQERVGVPDAASTEAWFLVDVEGLRAPPGSSWRPLSYRVVHRLDDQVVPSPVSLTFLPEAAGAFPLMLGCVAVVSLARWRRRRRASRRRKRAAATDL